MDQHRRYLYSPGFEGVQLSFSGRTLEHVDFSEVAFHTCSFNKSSFLTSPHVNVHMENCTFDGSTLVNNSMISVAINSCDLNGVDWTGTFKGVMKEQIERLVARRGTAADLDNLSVVATGEGIRTQIDEQKYIGKLSVVSKKKQKKKK
jgi:uncharacterized protein YjbI with pentapeptide repeats